MFGRLLRRARDGQPIAARLYGAIVAQARAPAFYRDLAVPDTVAGRFDLILLHAVLVSARLAGEGERGHGLRQGIFDAFVADMDRSLREMGVGDLAVPRRVRAMAEAFYGRMSAYEPALAAEDRTALADAIARNLFPDRPAPLTEASQIADYALAATAALDPADLATGELRFPAPEALLRPEAAA